MQDRLASKTMLSMVAIAASGAVRLVFSVLLGRSFGPTVLGHTNLLISVAVFTTLVSSPGLGQAVARQLALRSSHGDDPWGSSLLRFGTAAHHILCLVLALCVAILAPGSVSEHAFVGALTLAYGAYTYYKAVLYGVDKVSAYVRLELLWDAVFIGALVAVVWAHATALLLVPMVLLYGGFSVLAGALLKTPRQSVGRRMRVDSSDRRAVGTFAVATAVGTASSTGFLQLSMVFAAHAEPGRGAGLFAAAVTLVTPAYLLPRALSTVLFPAMARASGRADRIALRRQLELGSRLLVAGLLPLFAVAACLAPLVVSWVYGPEFANANKVFILMIWATWVSIAGVPAVNALSSEAGRSYLIPMSASVAGFLIGLGWWLLRGGSIESVGWGYLVGSVVQSYVPMAASWRRHRSPSAGLLGRSTAAAVLAGAFSLMYATASPGARILVLLTCVVTSVLLVLPELRQLLLVRHRSARESRLG